MATQANASAAAARDTARQNVLAQWAADHGVRLDALDLGQQWTLFVGLQLLAVLGPVAVLRRLLGYLLAHCGMGLPGGVIAALLGISDRALRTTKALSPRQLLTTLRRPGNRKPKLRAHHAGPVARFLVEHPGAPAQQLRDFLLQQFQLRVDRTTLHRFLTCYGLGCLRSWEASPRPTPLLSAPRRWEAPSC